MNELTKVFSGRHAKIEFSVGETSSGATIFMRIDEQDKVFTSNSEADKKKFQASNDVKIISNSHPAITYVNFGDKQILTVFLRGRNKIDGGDVASMDVATTSGAIYVLNNIFLALKEWDKYCDRIENTNKQTSTTVKEVFKLVADAQEDMNPKINVLAEVKKMKELRVMYEDAKNMSVTYLKKAQGYQDEMIRIKQRAKKHIDLI